MRNNATSSSSPAGPPEGAGPRKPVVVGVVLVAIALIVGAVLVRKRPAVPEPSTHPGSSLQATAQLNLAPRSSSAPPEPVAVEPPPAPAVPTTTAPAPPAKPVTSPPPATPAVPAATGPAPSAYTRQLMNNLAGLDLTKGITPEQAAQWRGELDKLIKEGAASIPAIREFLEKNVDLVFEGVPGADQLGARSLRLALFDALAQIGGPEAVGLATRTLQTTADPREIAVLARTLEQMEPEQHRQQALNAAREALALAAQNPAARNVSPLFEVFQKYGGSDVAADLEQAATKWNYYAPMALAGLPDGAGIPSLIRIAQNVDGRFGASSRFALQMLAQLAPQYPDAAQALLEHVKTQRLPDIAWYGIASALAGTQIYYGEIYLDTAAPPPNATDPKSYSIPSNQQYYRSFNVSANWTAEQVQKQLQLIDQLRAASPQAAAALEPTRAALAARLGQ